MNGVERGGGGGKWKTLRERLGFKGIGCCGGGGGAIWGFGASSNMRVREEEEEEDDDDQEQDLHEDEMLGGIVGQIPVENNVERDCVGQIPAVASGINLAMALAAERHFRAAQDWDNGGVGVVGTTDSSEATATTTTTTTTTTTAATRMNSSGTTSISNTGTPMRVSLMRLLEDGDVADGEEEEEGTEGGEEEKVQRRIGGGGTTERGNDVVCCVCMRRKKGAAFIPCGHTFCRVCSRELWLNRGSCPLCNRSILEILDIF